MDFLTERMEVMRQASPLLDKYENRIDVVAQSVGDLSDHEAFTLATLLDNTERFLDRYARLKGLTDMNFSEVVGPYKKHAMNIISVMYTTFELKDLISIQPLTNKIGALYFLSYTYGSDKGNISAGDTIFDPQNKPTRSGYYSGQIVKEESLTFAFSTDSTASLAYFPLTDPSNISIVIVGGAAAGTWTYLSTGDGVYNLQLDDSGTVDGTINISTGLVTLDAVDASGATSALATYSWNSEKFSANAPIPRVRIGVNEETVTAKRRQLLFDIMLDATFDYENQFGGDINASVESAIIQEMQNELSYYVLDRLYNEATGNDGETYTFDLTPDTDQSLFEHAQKLGKFLQGMSTKLFQNYGRGRGNKIVTGDDLFNFVSVLPNTIWKAYDELGDPKGPYKAGRLFGKFDVYHNPAYAADKFVMCYKGTDWWEAPYFMGVYLPLMSSKFMMFPDMHAEQGYISMEAHKYLFPLHAAIGTVTES